MSATIEQIKSALRTVTEEDDLSKAIVLAAIDELAELRAKVNELTKDRDHWKANHDAQVSAARLLRYKTDLPVERAEAYDELIELRAKYQESEDAESCLAMLYGDMIADGVCTKATPPMFLTEAIRHKVHVLEKEVSELRAKLATMEEKLRWRTPDEEPDWSNPDENGYTKLELRRVDTGEHQKIYKQKFDNYYGLIAWRPALPGPGEQL